MGLPKTLSDLVGHLDEAYRVLRINTVPWEGADKWMVSTPYCLYQLDIDDRLPYRHVAKPEPDDMTFQLRLATTGWWEILVPSATAIRGLCLTLIRERVHVCAVSGLPAALAEQWLIGYRWYGPARHDVQSAGFLVALEWDSLVTVATSLMGPFLKSQHPDTSEATISYAHARCTAIVLGNVPLVSLYAPNPGKWNAAVHSSFLQYATRLLKELEQQTATYGWLLGDLNLRGLAEGSGASPAKGSAGLSLVKSFHRHLALHGLSVARSPPTHTRLGALDVFVGKKANCIHPAVALPVSGYVSDHSIMVVNTGAWLSTKVKDRGCPSTVLPEGARLAAYAWSRSPGVWRKALERTQEIQLAVAVGIFHTSQDAVTTTLDKPTRQLAADCATLLFDIIVVCSGHAGGALSRQRQNVDGARSKQTDVTSVLLRESEEALRNAAARGSAAASEAHMWHSMCVAASRKRKLCFLEPSWAAAVQQGNRGVEQWFAKKSRTEATDIPANTHDERRIIMQVRASVSQLDSRCSQDAEQRACQEARETHARMLDALQENRDRPAAVTHLADDGPAAWFFTAEAIRKSAKKKAANKSAAFVPAAAMHGLLDSKAGEYLLWGWAELTWATACWSRWVLTVLVTHAYKGRGLPVNEVSSFRPLGLVHPLLSTGSDLLMLRAGPALTGLAGANQLGGARDARCAFISFAESRAIRRERSLPTVEVQFDARGGYDGGRHARYMKAVAKARARPREQVLIHDLLSRHAIRPKVQLMGRLPSVLPVVQRGAGGTIQGLSCSGPIYCGSKANCGLAISASAPPPCCVVPDHLWSVFSKWYTASYEADDPMDLEALYTLARVCRSSSGSDPLLNTAFQHMCANDSERLWLLDLLCEQDTTQATLFVDDGRTKSSSPAAAVMVVDAVHTYAVTNGVIYDAGPRGKAKVLADLVTVSAREGLQTALDGRLQGKSPQVLPSFVFLGLPTSAANLAGQSHIHDKVHKATSADAIKITNIVLMKCHTAMRTSCARAATSPWPLLARRYYLKLAPATSQYHAPLAVHDPRALTRLRAIQRRWAVAVLCGSWRFHLRLEPHILGRLLVDLGWKELWRQSLSQGIALYQSMRKDAPEFDHTRAATRDMTAHGSWISSVRKHMSRFAIDDWDPSADELDSFPRRKASLRKYRNVVVLPALGHDPSQLQALPWAWLATHAGRLFEPSAFDQWFALRTCGRFAISSVACLACCDTHRDVDCPRFQALLASQLADPDAAFEYPVNPASFVAVLRAINTIRQWLER